jgi:hypothetical protein
MKKLALVLIFLVSNLAIAQTDFDETDELPRDTVCFKYKFRSGDYLIYRVESRDSIVFDYESPLVRDRYERLIVICDSVSNEGYFYLSMHYTDYTAIESKGDIKDVRRNSSPWTDRFFYLVIDSLGNRIKATAKDKINAAVSPGGPFQPYLFFAFQQSCKQVNESWLVSTVDTLYENAFPPAVIEHSNLFRAEEQSDTLGYSCIKFRFIRTGNATYHLKTQDQNIYSTAVINSGGRMFISKEYYLPVHFFQTIEQKLRVYFSEENYKVGKHFTNSYFTLEEIIRK